MNTFIVFLGLVLLAVGSFIIGYNYPVVVVYVGVAAFVGLFAVCFWLMAEKITNG